MHAAVSLFLTRCTIPHPAPVVYEVGAHDHNGRARDYLPVIPARWVGFDLVGGAGVHVIGDAIDTLPGMEPCDVMVSTEVLEHAERWPLLLSTMCAAVRPGGWLVVTCAGPGRAPHGADGGLVQPGEHYDNVPAADIDVIAEAAGFAPIIVEQSNGDSRYFGRKENA